MANIPSASLSISSTGGAFAGGTGYIAVIGCTAKSQDITPRVFSSYSAALDQHDYSQAVDYVGLHVDAAKQPVILIGLPVTTAGAVGRQNSTGVTGSSAISVAAGSEGIMEETFASVTVVSGGTVGTDQITFNLSLDGGRTTKLIRLGTNNSYTIPYVGIVLNFGAGTLVAGDVYTFTTTAPMWGSNDFASAWTALAAQQLQVRSVLVVGDLSNSTFAGYVTSAADSYETADDRYVYARVNVRDRLPLAQMSQVKKQMTGSPNLTFAASGHTITRSAGDFTADGFAIGDMFTVAGSTSNNGTYTISSVTALVITLASGLSNEGPVANVTIVGSAGLTFAASGHTITRSAGNFLNDGFAVGDTPIVSGSASNNGTLPAITVLTATVMTFGSGIVNESVRSDLVTMTKGETMSAWVSSVASAFASVDDERRIDIGAGRLRKQSVIHQWMFRRPVAWAASTREYQFDLQIPCWRKADGVLTGWDMTDGNGKVVEYDERTVGGLLANRFTCARTYANGPIGSFIALSLTRDTEGSVLSRTHNLAVADLACTIAQAETENAIGQVLVLNTDGTGTAASLQQIEERVNTQLQINILSSTPPGSVRPEGPRASFAVWVADKTAVLNVPDATLDGVLTLGLDGTLEQIRTSVVVS